MTEVKTDKKHQILPDFMQQIICEKYNISAEQIHEFSPAEIYFTREEYFLQLREKFQIFSIQNCSMCQMIQGDINHNNCNFVVKQSAFWIDNHDFILLCWNSGLLNCIHKIKREEYRLQTDTTG